MRVVTIGNIHSHDSEAPDYPESLVDSHHRPALGYAVKYQPQYIMVRIESIDKLSI
jgi:hypothetical protein